MAAKVVQMHAGCDDDRELILERLRVVIREGNGIAQVQAGKLLWEMLGKPTKKPENISGKGKEPIEFLIAGPLDEDEIQNNRTATCDTETPGEN